MSVKTKEKLPEKRLRLIGRLEDYNNKIMVRGEDLSERILTSLERYNVVINAEPGFLLEDSKYQQHVELAVSQKEAIGAAIKGKTQWEIGFHIYEILRQAPGVSADVRHLFGVLGPHQRFLLLERLGL